MQAHAQAVAGTRGDVLNVGFGMGLVDSAIQVRRGTLSGMRERAAAKGPNWLPAFELPSFNLEWT